MEAGFGDVVVGEEAGSPRDGGHDEFERDLGVAGKVGEDDGDGAACGNAAEGDGGAEEAERGGLGAGPLEDGEGVLEAFAPDGFWEGVSEGIRRRQRVIRERNNE